MNRCLGSAGVPLTTHPSDNLYSCDRVESPDPQIRWSGPPRSCDEWAADRLLGHTRFPKLVIGMLLHSTDRYAWRVN